MPERSQSTKRLIRMVQTRDHTIHQAIYTAVAAFLGTISLALHAPQPFSYALLAIAGYFLLGSVTNLWAYFRHKKSAQSVAIGDETSDDRDVVQKISLPPTGGAIEFVYSRDMTATHADCIEAIRVTILNDKEAFSQRFVKFKAENAAKYPKYAHFISALQIKSLRILRAKQKGKCIASIRFAEDAGDVWSAQYSDETFSDLIWM